MSAEPDASPPPPRFEYALHPLRGGLSRWRWELWHRGAMLAAGWSFGRQQAEGALCAAASRRVHALAGVHPLHPQRSRPSLPLPVGAAVEVQCGAVSCLLAPRLPGARGWSLQPRSAEC